jgi:hypothetical protein
VQLGVRGSHQRETDLTACGDGRNAYPRGRQIPAISIAIAAAQASGAGGAGMLRTWLARSTCRRMDRNSLWGLMQCRIEQEVAFELGRVARLLIPHRLQAR